MDLEERRIEAVKILNEMLRDFLALGLPSLVDSMINLISEVQWGSFDGCCICSNDKHEGHEEGCRLSKLLAEAQHMRRLMIEGLPEKKERD
jgi:hypothetical protein